MTKVIFRVMDRDYNCLAEYFYISKVGKNSTNRQRVLSQTYIRSKMHNLLREIKNSYEVVVDYVDCV
jgi:hypothetical protein